LQDVRLFDVYAGKGLPEGSHSLSFRLEFNRADQTLRDEDVDPRIAAIVKQAEKLGAELRS
jgi:phenylalanyl-tRNA synthetase beta chain